MNLLRSDWPTILLAAAVLLLAAGGGVYWLRRRPPSPEERERRRRAYLNQVGRIVEGQILDIREISENRGPHGTGDGRRTLVYYSYSISGVSYETAQDITGLEERACRAQLISGQPVSVKYDPANPANSILIADDWTGLH
ncbi:MAG: DUF3592 domain-containing protein [Firmicutes bacterium]|nr:DUF3592 domain-containing protein [Bacillota bacterium]